MVVNYYSSSTLGWNSFPCPPIHENSSNLVKFLKPRTLREKILEYTRKQLNLSRIRFVTFSKNRPRNLCMYMFVFQVITYCINEKREGQFWSKKLALSRTVHRKIVQKMGSQMTLQDNLLFMFYVFYVRIFGIITWSASFLNFLSHVIKVSCFGLLG